MRRLIVYAGANGAGKSTLRDVGDDRIEIVIDADRIAREMPMGRAEQVQIQAGRIAIRLFEDSIAAGKMMSLETTLAGQTILNRMRNAKRNDYDVELRYVCLGSPDLHINRVQQRVRNGGHDIPPETIIRRYHQSLANLSKAICIANRAIIIDNSNVEKRTLLRVENGMITERDPAPPSWLGSLLPELVAALARGRLG